MSELRKLPAVDQLLGERSVSALLEEFGRELTIATVREVLDEIRKQLKNGKRQSTADREEIIEQVRRKLIERTTSSLRSVINATGVILHTNLGRAPLSREALKVITEVSGGYCTLEYDLRRGGRGTRSMHVEDILCSLTGAESALVVNNNAAALLLILSALAKRKPVVIARSQLVEIGGGFRIPDVMAQSGAKLIEVGTTNQVHLEDYRRALQASVALVVRAHHSNFKIIGFTSEPNLKEIVEVSHARGVPVVDDLGSGALLDTAQFGLAHEPMVQESFEAGADLICFSGDKLLGGPQAGIIVGKAELIEKIKKHPLARAVRADKMCLAGLATTLLHYLKGEALQKIPIWQMISASPESVHQRAVWWREHLGWGEVISGFSMVGGGSLPGETLPTSLLALEVPGASSVLQRLRELPYPIIARIEEDRLVFDPRTVLADQEKAFLDGLNLVLQSTNRTLQKKRNHPL